MMHGSQVLLIFLFVSAFATSCTSSDAQSSLTKYLKTHLPVLFPELWNYVPSPVDRKSCPKAIPGVRKMFQGVDISQFDFYPRDGFSQGFKDHVLSMTCNNGVTWYVDGVGFDLPDPMIHGVQNVGGGTGSKKVSIFQNTADIRKSLSASAGLSGGADYFFVSFSFSLSASYESMERTVKQSSRVITEVSAFENSFIITNTKPTLDKYVQKFIDNNLIGTYETNKSEYEKFIEIYGTHFFARASLGGLIKVMIETKSSYLSKTSKENLEIKAKAAFESLVYSASMSFGMSKGKSSSNSEFNKESLSSTMYFGGSANLLLSEGFTSWQPTVDKDPWLLEGVLVPISSLIKDNGKRVSMETAVQKHILRSYYKELLRSVKGDPKKVGKVFNVKEIIETVESTMGEPLVGEKRKNLVEMITNQLITPEWYEELRICIGQSGRRFCSKPDLEANDHIDWYRISNDDGGAKLIFSIKTVKLSSSVKVNHRPVHGNHRYRYRSRSRRATKPVPFPKWVNDIKLCVRYRGGVDTSCQGMGEQCTPINTYTSLSYKQKRTGNQLADCYLSWKLVTPNISPVWLEESKLCLQYGAHNLKGTSKLSTQCNLATGSETPYETCTSPNEWTPYWRDGTTETTDGKCWMRLVLKTAYSSV